jgi:hypothetical protein
MLCYLLIISLPTENTTARMRAWRSLKAAGAAVLRDGVYLLPASPQAQAGFAEVADDVRANGGTAYSLESDASAIAGFEALFDRSEAFAALMLEIAGCAALLSTGSDSAASSIKQARKLRKAFTQLASIDFFPAQAQSRTAQALASLEASAHQASSPNEPRSLPAEAVAALRIADYQGRVWATRSRPWADRLACAWLIRRHIDPQATLLWLAQPSDCPAQALGFDFDGAAFSHVGNSVTFEVMLASFGLQTPALLRLGALIHFLDVGGAEPAEAAGIERALAGMCSAIVDDDALLLAVSALFDGLCTAFEKDTK